MGEECQQLHLEVIIMLSQISFWAGAGSGLVIVTAGCFRRKDDIVRAALLTPFILLAIAAVGKYLGY